MLKQFNSNARKLNRIIPKINFNNLSGSLNDATLNIDITGSLLNISSSFSEPIKYNSNTKSNPNPTKLINNKNKINAFHNEILEFSARQIGRNIDQFDNTGFGKLTILNVNTDYGTEGASPDNFEILVYGLHIPGDYTIENVGSNVEITLGNDYIDFDNVTINDIYVIGKLIDIPVTSENEIILSTENNLDLII